MLSTDTRCQGSGRDEVDLRKEGVTVLNIGASLGMNLKRGKGKGRGRSMEG